MLHQNRSCTECLYLCAFTRTRLLWGSALEHLPGSLKNNPAGAEVREWLFTNWGLSEQIPPPPQSAGQLPRTQLQPPRGADRPGWCPLQGRPRTGVGQAHEPGVRLGSRHCTTRVQPLLPMALQAIYILAIL